MPPKNKKPGIASQAFDLFVLRLFYRRPTRWTESAGTLVPYNNTRTHNHTFSAR